MNIEVLKALQPTIYLSICSGIILIGAFLYAYIYLKSKKTLYLSTSVLGLIGFLFIFFEIITIASGIPGAEETGFHFHKMQAASAVFFLPALPFFIFHLIEHSRKGRIITKLLGITGAVVTAGFLVTVIFLPDLFLVRKPPGEYHQYIWNLGRGVPGPAYKIRDYLIGLWSIICIIILAREVSTRHHSGHLIFTFAGAIIAIITGAADILLAAQERAFGLFTTRIFSFFSLGVTVFIISSMIGVLKYFVYQTRGIERAVKLQSLGTLAGGIAHDFNNILTSIVGNVSLLEMDLPKESEEYRMCHDIETAAFQAKQLTQQLLTFSKGGTPVKKPTATSTLIQETIQFVLSGSNIQTELYLPEDLWNIEVDPGQISQVIQNIVINAKEAIKGRGTISVSSQNIPHLTRHEKKHTPGPFVKITICDDGEGMDKNTVKSIFDPYFSTKENGNGLGLYICYSVVSNHNGYIDVQSVPGSGTRFEIYLPASNKAPQAAETDENTNMYQEGKVLILEDEKAIQKVLEKMLIKMGVEPVFTAKGEETVEKYRDCLRTETPYDFIILDLTIIGGMGGIDTASEIKKLDPDAKLVVCSGYSQDPVMSDYQAFGFTDIIHKPYRLNDIKRITARMLKGSDVKSKA